MTALNSNLSKLKKFISRYESSGVMNHIHGQSFPSRSGETFSTVSPFDANPICEVAKSSQNDVAHAVSAARAAFQMWRDMDGVARKKILHRMADIIEERAEEIALCESWDSGQPIRYMSKAAVRGAENFRYFADRAPAARDGQSLPSPGLLNVTTRVPIGPVAVITPWNTPFMLSTWKIAPALASGCTVVHKPAELAPITAKILAEIGDLAGLPPGVLNVINGYGEEAGVALTKHHDIRAVSFVGEGRTGAAIMKQGADTLKRVHFELGGKNPVIVFDDADIERALDAVIFMIYSLNGERCTSSSRLILHKSLAGKFIARLCKRTEHIKVGHPLDPATELGPLIHKTHLEKVQLYLEIAPEEGADIAVGGHTIERKGWFVQPTVITGVRPEMRVAQEEIFGPVLVVIPFEEEEEAIKIANRTRYGLAGYVWTNDLPRALRVSDAMEAGMVWVNSENVRHLSTPFGGMKDSGIGRDGGDWSFEFYMEQKHVALSLGKHRIPKIGVE